MDKILRNYQMYDKKGRRLSIFGEYLYGQLNIVIFTCSKADVFSKKEAKNLFAQYKIPGDAKYNKFFIPCEEKSSKFAFNTFCKTNFTKIHESTIKVKGKIVSWKQNTFRKWDDTYITVKSLF